MCSNIKEIMCLIFVFIIGNIPINCSEATKKQEMKDSLRIIELHQGILLASKETHATIIDTNSANKAFYLRHRLKERNELFPLEIDSNLQNLLNQTSKPFNIVTEDSKNTRQCYNIISLQHDATSMDDDVSETLMFEPQDVKIEQITSNNDRPPHCEVSIGSDRVVSIRLTGLSIKIRSLFREDLQQLKLIKDQRERQWKISFGGLAFEINSSKISKVSEALIKSAQSRPSEAVALPAVTNIISSPHADESKIPFYKSKLFVVGGTLTIITITLFSVLLSFLNNRAKSLN